MNRCVFFTCVGNTDPIRDNFDGGMLHIIRYYRPHTVYIFFSEEMGKREKSDGRYSKAAEMLAEFLDMEIKIEKFFSHIRAAHDFDAYMDIFGDIIGKIRQDNGDDTIILNLSSGTPQMKTTMCLETLFTPGNVLPVQVSSPEQKSNISKVVGIEYDVELEFQNNLDNLPDAPNRCSEPNIISVRRAMAKSQLITLIENYNYSAAKIFVKDFYPEVGKKALQLIEHAILRLDLQDSLAIKAVEGIHDMVFYPVKDCECRIICEYLNMLEVCYFKGDISGFVLRLNPLIVELQSAFIKKEFKMDVSILTQKTSWGESFIRIAKIQNFDSDMLKYISTNHYSSALRDRSMLNIRFQNAVIDYYVNGKGKISAKHWLKFFVNIEKINEKYRNSLAHDLFGATEKQVKELSGMSIARIIRTLKALIRGIYQNRCKEEIFHIYQDINQRIIMEIQ